MRQAEDRKYGTPFVETEILLAMKEMDGEHALALLAEMTPTERRGLEWACEQVSSAIQVMREESDE
ncbi:hypothetical protein AB0C10_16145 [Microbispora amethystogenes]|uniref:hypothetical protein n=1 Tax=Microbispora amethystogenes TaxID=1427754 RepID=UPI0033D7AA9B